MFRRFAGRDAFTLIELIISMTIVAVILVVVFGAFRIGIRAWERGEKDIDKHQRYRIVLEMVRHQMMSPAFEKIKVEDSEQFVFKGDAKSFEFLSHISLKPENKFGIVFVRYRVDGDRQSKDSLWGYEENVVLFDEDFSPDEIDSEKFFELLPAAHRISFEYLKPPQQGLEENASWQEDWDPEYETGVPLAVKLSLVDQPDSTPLTVLVPIYQKEDNPETPTVQSGKSIFE